MSNPLTGILLKELEIGPVLNYINFRLDTIQENGRSIKCFCPIHKESILRTLTIDKAAKRYRCSFANCPGKKSGDLIELTSLSKQISYDDAATQLAHHFNLSIPLAQEQKKAKAETPAADEPASPPKKPEAPKAVPTEADKKSKTAEVKKKIAPNDPMAQITSLKEVLELGRIQDKPERVLKALQSLSALYMQQGLYQDASDALQEYLAEKNDDIQAHLQRGECLKRLGHEEEMLSEMMAVAALLEANGELDKALDVYRQLDALESNLIDVAPYIVQILADSGRVGEAIEELVLRGTKAGQAGDSDQAIAFFDEALELVPGDTALLNRLLNLAFLLCLDEDYAERLLSALEQTDDKPALEKSLAILQGARPGKPGDFLLERICSLFEILGRNEELEQLAIEKAQSFFQECNYDASLAWIDRALGKNKASVKALQQKAALQEALGNIPGALGSLLDAARQLDGSGQSRDALPLYAKALALAPDDLKIHYQRLCTLARIGLSDELVSDGNKLLPKLKGSDDLDMVLSILEVLIENDPSAPQYHGAQAAALLRLELPSDAAAALRHAVDLYTVAGNIDAGIEDLSHLIDLEPESARNYEQRAELHLQNGDMHDSLQDLDRAEELYEAADDPLSQLRVINQAARLEPENPERLERLLALHQSTGKDEEALAARRRLIVFYMAKGNFSGALQHCLSIRNDHPDDVDAIDACIHIHQATRQIDQLRRDLLHLLEIRSREGRHEGISPILDLLEHHFPNDPEILNRRLLMACENGDWDGAMPLLHRIVEINDRCERNEDSLHLIEGLMNRHGEVNRLFPNWMALQCTTGQVKSNWEKVEKVISDLESNGRRSLIIEVLQDLSNLSPEFEPLRSRHIQLLEQAGMKTELTMLLRRWAQKCLSRNDRETAARYYQKAIEVHPGNLDLLAEVFEFRIAAGLKSGVAELAIALCEQLEGQGLILRSINVLESATEIDPERDDLVQRLKHAREMLVNPKLLKERYLEIAAKQTAQRQWSDARNTLTESIRKFPHDFVLRRRLFETLIQMDLNDQAISELAAISTLQAEMGDFENAMQTVAEILEIDPEHIKAQSMQAELHARMGNKELALEEFRTLSRRLDDASKSAIGMQLSGAALTRIGALPVKKEYSFDEFVVGARNNFAYAAAMAVAKEPGKDYNPLFLYSDVGLGKTHLLNSIANYVLANAPDSRLLYTSIEEFTSELVEAIRSNTIREFRAYYRSADILLIDDVQFLAEKERAQEEFFQVFNSLHQANRQIVLTSDRPPKEISHLEKRLRSRFGAGIIVDIQTPDLETRTAILRSEAEKAGFDIEESSIALIAKAISSNIRDLKATLNQVVAQARIIKQLPNEEMVRQVIERVAG